MGKKELIETIDKALLSEIDLLGPNDFAAREQATRTISTLAAARKKICNCRKRGQARKENI